MNHASASHAAPHAQVGPYDGNHAAEHHGHVIVSLVTLRLVLGALLFFTLLTVGASAVEQWVAHALNVELPGWINVAVALSIAVVKTILVVGIFMQLKYDSPTNSMIFVFTILTVAFFLGFTALDLAGRGTLDRGKAVYEYEGGTGLTGVGAKGTVSDGLTNVPITEAARKVAIANGTYDEHHAHHEDHGAGDDITAAGYRRALPVKGSSAAISRQVKGVTIRGLPGYVDPMMKGSHGHGAGEHGGTGGAKHEPMTESQDAPKGNTTPAPAKAPAPAKPH